MAAASAMSGRPFLSSDLEEARIPRDSLGVFVLVAKLSSNSVQVTRELTRPKRAKHKLISYLRGHQQCALRCPRRSRALSLEGHAERTLGVRSPRTSRSLSVMGSV